MTMWEHEFDVLLSSNSILNNKYRTLNIDEPLIPRLSLYGGRVEALRLLWSSNGEGASSPDSFLNYFDFCSLYPAKMTKAAYPLYHPKVIVDNFQSLDNYFGLIKVDVLPPKKLLIPVLPCRIREKLMFVLCTKCAEENNQSSPCTCTDSDRAIRKATYVTEELKLAVEFGYKILKIYEVYHYKHTTDNTIDPITGKKINIFSDYVRTFMKIKQSASGWPKPDMSEIEKKLYIEEYKMNEGIQLEYDEIMKNPGKRIAAKICMNSLFGKLAQGVQASNTKFINSQHKEELIKLLSDPRITIKDFNVISSDIITLEYADKSNIIHPGVIGNSILSSFTTAHARVDLFKLIYALGQRALYADTDSVIFESTSNDVIPPTGPYLGDLTSEIDEGDKITEFVCTGPKS